MQISSRVRKGAAFYASIPLSENVNADMLYLYNLHFSYRTSGGQQSGTIEQIAITAGQYRRICVAILVIEHVELASRSGGLFSVMIDRKPLQVFLTYFNIRCSVTTVLAKANQILKLIEVGEVFFQEKGDNMSLRKFPAAR